jgi:excinuclease UvrABC ATPase subunit
MKKCPTCEGSGRYYEPSNGYENSKSGRCFNCGGDGTFLSFSKRMITEYTFKLKSYKESLDFYQEETPKLEQFLKEMNEAINENQNT